jgi:putative transferase (TIGR04331 family)
MNSALDDCQKNIRDVHIALSLDKRYWPEKSKAVLFDISSYESASRLFSGGFLMAPSPWETDVQSFDATDKINSYHDSLIQTICDAFNEMFNTNKSKQYYRILLGPTLHWMLNVFYDRFFRVCAIYKEFPNIKFPVTDYNESFFNNYDFVVAAKTNEHYNAKIISYVTRSLNKQSNYRIYYDPNHFDLSKNKLFSNLAQKINKCKPRVLDVLNRTYLRFAKKPRIMFYNIDIDVSISDILKYKLYRCLDVSPGTLQKEISLLKNDKMREELYILMKKHLNVSSDSFLECFLEFFTNELPLVYLENYCFYDSWSKKQQQKYTMEVICSSIGWYFDEYFTYFAAWSAEQGAKLVGFQHGGNYQILKKHFCFEHEVKITDLYFTLGKTDKINDVPDVWLPKKFQFEHKVVKVDKKNILFVSTSPCKFLIEFPCTTEKSSLYLKRQFDFLNYLQKKYSEDLVFRPYHIDNVWNIKEYVREFFPKIKIDTNPNFSLSVVSSKLLIFDHLSTTFLESLALNKPTILCWSKELYCINENSEKYFDDLVKHQILHHCYKKATCTIQRAFSIGLENWWFDSERQECLHRFLKKFTLRSVSPDIAYKSTILKRIQKIYIEEFK